jgi:SHS family sialic acid transporter-like MFS transporter
VEKGRHGKSAEPSLLGDCPPKGCCMRAETSSTTAGRWSALVAAVLGWMFDGMEMGLFPLVGRSALRDLLSGRMPASGGDPDAVIGQWFGAMLAVFLVGAALGGLLFGWLGDRVGRVRAMQWSILTYSLFTGLCAFVQTPEQLGLLRFIASLGMGGEWSVAVALVMEVWPERARPLLAGLIGAAANVGFVLIAVVGLVLATWIQEAESLLRALGFPEEFVAAATAHSGWRLVMAFGAVPALLTFFIRLFVPESQRWKQAVRHGQKAQVLEIFRAGVAARTVLATSLGAVALLGTWGSVQWIPSWVDQQRELEQAPSGAPLEQEQLWVRNPRAAVQICTGSGAVIGTALAALAAQRWNRRFTYFGLAVLAFGFCQWLFRGGFAYGLPMLVLCLVVGGLAGSFFGWLPLYLPELFPTRLRATAQGFAYNAGRIVAAGGTLVSGSLVQAFGGDYALMCASVSSIYLAGALIIWLCPETKGKPLPE